MNRFFPMRESDVVTHVFLDEQADLLLGDAVERMADHLATRLAAVEERDAGHPARDDVRVNDGFKAMIVEERVRIAAVKELARMVRSAGGGSDLRELACRLLLAIERGNRFDARRRALLAGRYDDGGER